MFSAHRVPISGEANRNIVAAATGVLCRGHAVPAAAHPEYAGGVPGKSLLRVGSLNSRSAHVHVFGTFFVRLKQIPIKIFLQT